MTTLTNKNIEKWVEKMREHLTIPMQPQNLFLVYTKIEWLTDPRLVYTFGWDEKDIDNADKNGLIGTREGVDCYISKQVRTIML